MTITKPTEFLPLPVRRGIYLIALAGAVAAPIIAVNSPEYAAAIIASQAALTAAAGVTALANPARRPRGEHVAE